MAYLKADEIRGMVRTDRLARLKELRGALMNERGVAAMGGSPPSPGKIRQIRRQIARILTIQREDEIKGVAKAATPATAPAPRAEKPRAAPKKSHAEKAPTASTARAAKFKKKGGIGRRNE